MKNTLIMLVIICTLFLPISCASRQKHEQPEPDEVNRLMIDSEPGTIKCSDETPEYENLTPAEREYLDDYLLNSAYLGCISNRDKLDAERKNRQSHSDHDDQMDLGENEEDDEDEMKPRRGTAEDVSKMGTCLIEILDVIFMPY